MHARILTVQIQHDRLDEASRLYQEQLLPAVRQQSGFKGSWLLVDRHTGKGLAILLWETETDLRAGEANHLLQQQIAQMARTFVSTPLRELFEVAVQPASH
jgi:hypothetical protein